MYIYIYMYMYIYCDFPPQPHFKYISKNTKRLPCQWKLILV